MDMIIKLTGEALVELFAELAEGCRTLRIAVDDGEVKLKADEGMWTTGLAGATVERPTEVKVAASLTRRQREVLEMLRRGEPVWPAGRATKAPSSACRTASRATLDALVAAGHARWIHTPGVMPHVRAGQR